MVDSHALVGSCAQVGRRVTFRRGPCWAGCSSRGSAAGDRRGRRSGGWELRVYEGTIIGRRAVLGSGVILTGSSPCTISRARPPTDRGPDAPLRIPMGRGRAGSRRVSARFAERHGLHLYTPIIVKYRDEKTDASPHSRRRFADDGPRRDPAHGDHPRPAPRRCGPGVVAVTSGDVTKGLYFRRGRFVFAASTWRTTSWAVPGPHGADQPRAVRGGPPGRPGAGKAARPGPGRDRGR